MSANTGVHTCSYYCERPECVRRQRDELRDRLEAALAQQPAAPSGEAVAYRWRDRGTMQMVYSSTNPGYCNVEPLYAAPQQPTACVGCEGKPTPENSPCAVCGQQPVAVDRARFRKAPCYLCGYNGAGYFQSETHPCAALYHAAQQQGGVE